MFGEDLKSNEPGRQKSERQFLAAGGGAFFLASEDFGRMFDYSFPACAFFEMEISSRTLIPLFRPESVDRRSFPDKLCVSSFPDRFPHYARTAA